MKKSILITGTLMGMIAIGLGAFAAHGLKELISGENLITFETGVKYQMYHSLFLLILGISNLMTNNQEKVLFYLILIGVILFSGSIYGLATNSLTSFDFRTIALVTPVGGLLLICGWMYLLISLIKLPPSKWSKK